VQARGFELVLLGFFVERRFAAGFDELVDQAGTSDFDRRFRREAFAATDHEAREHFAFLRFEGDTHSGLRSNTRRAAPATAGGGCGHTPRGEGARPRARVFDSSPSGSSSDGAGETVFMIWLTTERPDLDRRLIANAVAQASCSVMLGAGQWVRSDVGESMEDDRDRTRAPQAAF
jgi:hypothetical protein